MEKDQEEKPLVHFAKAKLGANTGMDAQAEPCSSPLLFADSRGEKATDAEHTLGGERPGREAGDNGHQIGPHIVPLNWVVAGKPLFSGAGICAPSGVPVVDVFGKDGGRGGGNFTRKGHGF